MKAVLGAVTYLLLAVVLVMYVTVFAGAQGALVGLAMVIPPVGQAARASASRRRTALVVVGLLVAFGAWLTPEWLSAWRHDRQHDLEVAQHCADAGRRGLDVVSCSGIRDKLSNGNDCDYGSVVIHRAADGLTQSEVRYNQHAFGGDPRCI